MTSEARPTDHDNLPAPEGALFITRLDRDAWATIRGYVYQMALTVERWLNLQDGQILELERGEDIDVISTGLSANDLQMDRLLEQVKHREVNVTLRSAPALQALSSAIAHRASNASMSLTFRYTTNAQAGVEAESPFESGISAIAVWERLRTGELTDGEQDVAADGILTILRTCGKPNDLSAEAWQPLVDFVAAATTADLLDLVRSFEWGTGSGDRGEVEGRAKAWLLERGTADGSEGAQTIYEHLFAFVANRLTERGLKRLTTAERQTQVAMPFSTANQRSLPRVSALLRELDKRVEAL